MLNRAVWFGTALVILLAALISLNFPAVAQGDTAPKTATPPPSPTGNGGKATWIVKSRTFETRYPNGFAFRLEASSTGGKIVEAGVVWSHAPGYQQRRPGVIDPGSGKITASWARTTDGVPQWVGLDYWWVLRDEAGNTYQTDRKHAEYADNKQQWHRLESEDVIVFWEEGVPDDVGPLTVQAMRERRPFYLRAWGKLLPYKPRAIIYNGPAAIKEWYPDFEAGGTTSPGWGGTLQIHFAGKDPRATAYSYVLHEVGHLYQSASGAPTPVDWFIEGNATYFEAYQPERYLDYARQRARAGTLPTLQDSGPSIRGSRGIEGYYIGAAFFVWLEQVYGPDAHRKLWATMTAGRTRNDALKAVTGLNFIDMETAFRTWLGASNPVAPTALPTPEFIFWPSPTPEPTPG